MAFPAQIINYSGKRQWRASGAWLETFCSCVSRQRSVSEACMVRTLSRRVTTFASSVSPFRRTWV